MEKDLKAEQLAEALLSSHLSQREQEEWAIFSMYLTDDQVDELIMLLNKQTKEADEALAKLRSEVETEK